MALSTGRGKVLRLRGGNSGGRDLGLIFSARRNDLALSHKGDNGIFTARFNAGEAALITGGTPVRLSIFISGSVYRVFVGNNGGAVATHFFPRGNRGSVTVRSRSSIGCHKAF